MPWASKGEVVFLRDVGTRHAMGGRSIPPAFHPDKMQGFHPLQPRQAEARLSGINHCRGGVQVAKNGEPETNSVLGITIVKGCPDGVCPLTIGYYRLLSIAASEHNGNNARFNSTH